MAIEAPGERWMRIERVEAGDFFEMDGATCERRVGSSEAFNAAEVWQAGINPMPAPGSNN